MKLPVAKVLREFGLRGEVKVRIYLQPPDPFFKYRKFTLETRLGVIEVELESFRRTFASYAILKFKGIDTKEKAKKLRGVELLVDEKDLPPKREGEYYIYELEGLEVFFKGKSIGRIKEVIPLRSYPLFRIELENDETYVPFHKEFVEKVDTDGGKVILKRVPEWEI